MKSRLLRTFKPGLKYVFTTKLYLQCERMSDVRTSFNISNLKCPPWAKKLNGREVTVEDSFKGYIDDTAFKYGMLPAWCKCIGRDDNE